MRSAQELVAGATAPLVVVDDGPIRFLILNRPQSRNALSREMRSALPGILGEAERDRAVRTVVVTGVDPAFSAGMDTGDGDPLRPVLPNPGEALRSVRKPVIAAVNGACVTGALELALSCSFIIASESAFFADTHARLGLLPSWGQTALLPEAIGVRRARHMLATSERIDARTAVAWGLANEVVSHDRLIERCRELGGAVAASPDSALDAVLAGVDAGARSARSAALAVEHDAFTRGRLRPQADGQVPARRRSAGPSADRPAQA
jgi:enoyl-CoA hydratase